MRVNDETAVATVSGRPDEDVTPGTGTQTCAARMILTAALNPPAKPEIVVTDEMLRAGLMIWCGYNSYADTGDNLRRAYRAMRALEPKP